MQNRPDPYVIAEIGSTHSGRLPHILDTVTAAASAGANAVKLQWTSAPRRMRLARRIDAEGAYNELAWDEAWLTAIRPAVKAAGLDLIVTVFLPQDVSTISPYVDAFKIASLEAHHIPMRLAVEEHRGDRPVIISTGACTERQLQDLLRWRSMDPKHQTYLLHCTSGYPTPLTETNLRTIGFYALNGFSDHTANIATGGLAVAAGARILEVHVRHPLTSTTNPDFPHSLTFSQLHEYIGFARRAALALGTARKAIAPSEAITANHHSEIWEDEPV